MSVGVSGDSIWVQMYPEAVYGVEDATPTNILTLEIPGADGFTAGETPLPWEINSATGRGVRRKRGNNRSEVRGTFRTATYFSQYVQLLGWAVNVTAGDLASFTIKVWDGVEVYRCLGAKCSNVQGASAADSDIFFNTFAFQAKSIVYGGTTFPEPAVSLYPAENPFVHEQAPGTVIVNGTTYSDGIRGLTYNITNRLFGAFEGLRTISSLTYNGQDAAWSFTRPYTTNEFRALFTDQTPFAASFAWTYPGTPNKVLTMDFQDRNYVTDRPQPTRNFGEKMYEVITGGAALGSTSGITVAFTHSP